MYPTSRQRPVHKEVLRFLAERRMFTAYEITRFLRDQGMHIAHDQVREVVHGMYARNLMGYAYERTLMDVGGANGPAYVYHHYEDNPEVYPLEGRNKNEPHGLTPIWQPLARIIEQMQVPQAETRKRPAS